MTRPLPEVLAAVGRPRVLVVGDLMVDRYLTGAVDRISPEAPIQVLRVESESERMGGAASVAANAAVLGARTTVVGVIGPGDAGLRLQRMAEEAGVALAAVRDPARKTSVKTRHVARSHATAQQVLRVDEETIRPLAPEVEAEVRLCVERVWPGTQALLLSDYGKGVLTPDLVRRLIDTARRAGVPVLVDPKGEDYSRYRGATCVTPNRSEARHATGIPVDDPASAERAAEALIRDVELDFVLITMDRDGMYLKVDAERGVHIPTTPREVFDVTGAGDVVVSVLAVALASGASPHEAAMLANVAAGLEVERVGAVPISKEEIAARLAQGPEGALAKRVDRSEIGAVVARHRAAGRRVVFTNGCFDVLHAGHVRYLSQARALGDVLVVGLNSDESVRRLKGSGRPVNPLADRIEVLAALSNVDHVVVFEEERAVKIVEEVAPDVLVKGGDYAGKVVDGRESVEGRGGRVVLLPLLPGRSTSAVLERLGPD